MKRINEVLVGAVILLGVAVTVVGSLWLKGSNFGRPVVLLDVLVPEVGQLAEGNQVKFRGVAVGRVTSFDIEPSGSAVRVHLQLDQRLALPEDVGAVISPESLFGEWQVELVSRSAVRFEFLDVPPVDSAVAGDRGGDGVPLLPGFAMPDITRLTAAANEISQNIAVLTDRVDRSFNEETAENIRVAIENISEASSNIRALIDQQATVFEEVTREVQRASGEIALAAETGRVFLDRADALMQSGQVDSVLASAARATGDFERLTSNLASASDGLGSTVTRADSVLARFDRFSAGVERGDGVLGQLLGDTVLLERAGEVLAELELLLADVRANPRRYVRLSIF